MTFLTVCVEANFKQAATYYEKTRKRELLNSPFSLIIARFLERILKETQHES
jgi:hypothetical protein